MSLFFNYREEKLTRQGITYILQKYAENAGIGKITPHILRHSKAAHPTKADTNPAYIRDFPGHTGLKVTRIYSKASVKTEWDVTEKFVGQKAPLLETDFLARTKNWVDDKEFMSWLNSLGR